MQLARRYTYIIPSPSANTFYPLNTIKLTCVHISASRTFQLTVTETVFFFYGVRYNVGFEILEKTVDKNGRSYL